LSPKKSVFFMPKTRVAQDVADESSIFWCAGSKTAHYFSSKERVMKFLPGCVAAILLGVVALSAGPASAVQQTPAWGGHFYPNQYLAGYYTGTVTDSVLGTGTAAAGFAESWAAIGGTVDFSFGSGASATNVYNPASGFGGWGGVRGVWIQTIASTVCSFGFRAQYNPSSFVLSGNYQAINGCSGENGSFTMTEQCYYSEYPQYPAKRTWYHHGPPSSPSPPPSSSLTPC
jgi:hypothetical protein